MSHVLGSTGEDIYIYRPHAKILKRIFINLDKFLSILVTSNIYLLLKVLRARNFSLHIVDKSLDNFSGIPSERN